MWGIGCLAYVLINGDCPFNTKKDVEEFKELRWMLEKNNLAPQSVDFIELCLNSDPNSRIQLASLIHHPWINMYN